MLPHDHRFVPNTPDDLHCFQAAFRMAWQGLLGEPLNEQEADRLTGFGAGLQTWPFSGMLSAAEAGLTVASYEDFDPAAFVRDPEAEIRRQAEGDEDLVQHVLEVSALGPEQEKVRLCLRHPSIRFTRGCPSYDDLQAVVSAPTTAVLCNVNYKMLVGKDGYNGHFVLVTSATTETVVLDDPGLPPLRGGEFTAQRFAEAWTSPTPRLANILSLAIVT